MGQIRYHNPYPRTSSTVDHGKAQRLADSRFYKRAAWLKLRSIKLDANPLCERCEADGLTVVAAHVHHVKARKTHPHLELDLDNLEALCLPCHTKEENQRREKNQGE